MSAPAAFRRLLDKQCKENCFAFSSLPSLKPYFNAPTWKPSLNSTLHHFTIKCPFPWHKAANKHLNISLEGGAMGMGLIGNHIVITQQRCGFLLLNHVQSLKQKCNRVSVWWVRFLKTLIAYEADRVSVWIWPKWRWVIFSAGWSPSHINIFATLQELKHGSTKLGRAFVETFAV